MKRQITFFILFFLIFQTICEVKAQLIFDNLPKYNIEESDLNFLGTSNHRRRILLNGEWKVFDAEDKEAKKFRISVPSFFNGEKVLVYEKDFPLSAVDISSNVIKLNFLSLSYSAVVELNGSILLKHPGGEFPFSVELPKDILRHDKKNILRIILDPRLDPNSTIPSSNQFLFPKNSSGITGDVFLSLYPNIYLEDFSFGKEINFTTQIARLNVSTLISNKNFQKVDSLVATNFELRATVTSNYDQSKPVTTVTQFSLSKGKQKKLNLSLEIPNVILWSPVAPFTYSLNIELLSNGLVIDNYSQSISFYDLRIEKDTLYLNDKKFSFDGVTYYPSNGDFGKLFTYEQIRHDIELIKKTGFNSVRFGKSIPHPYFISLCEEYGLFAFLDIPVANINPGNYESKENRERLKNFLSQTIRGYKKFSSLAGICVGTFSSSSSDDVIKIFNEVIPSLKKDTRLIVYADFESLNSEIDGIDFYGFKAGDLSPDILVHEFKLHQEKFGYGKIILSDAGYIANLGSSNGYINPKTFEAQAKYFEDILGGVQKEYYAGYFLNAMFDYRTNYSSLVSGYNPNGLIKIGLADENRSLNRITFKVVYSKLNNMERVTIPIGLKKDDTTMVFIIVGLFLAVIFGLLINSGKKFREDATRALVRPYNFFSDVRDMRMISMAHTIFLMISISGVLSLVTSSLLYYWRFESFLEKIILSFGEYTWMDNISYLAYHPVSSLIFFITFYISFFLITTITIRLFALLVLQRVYFSNAFYTAVWSFIPFALLLPFVIPLHRILILNVGTLYIYLAIAAVYILSFHRLLKGIYVIYDTHPGKVYLYGLILLFVTLGGFLLYYQIQQNTLDFLLLAFKNFQLFGA